MPWRQVPKRFRNIRSRGPSSKRPFHRGITLSNVEDFEAVAGQGVLARMGQSRLVVGNARFLSTEGVALPGGGLDARLAELEASGSTVIGVARDGALLGWLALGDALRADAVETVERLHALGIRTTLLTGDNARAARHFAAAASIDESPCAGAARREAALVRQLQTSSRVAMVGDGINDAPALMQADVGIAFGHGADIAIESADVIILNARLAAVLDAYMISRHSYQKIVQNVLLAFLFNGIGIPGGSDGPGLPRVGHGRHGGQRDDDFRQFAMGPRRLFF
ncbi:HAD-IC family P-type ATPase [Cupriavidus metallidurans]|uniref:HAD-IC family P-type ATPase n=1 Tax=Cupriavidus metallidurans TaxID=119219 RepID=UPI0026BED2F5